MVIKINDVEYTYSHTNNNPDFIWDWEENCSIEPTTEEIYVDVNGNEYVLYKTDSGDVVGTYLNID
jgi:hypothetical protein